MAAHGKSFRPDLRCSATQASYAATNARVARMRRAAAFETVDNAFSPEELRSMADDDENQ